MLKKGAPVLRPLSYNFPNRGYENIKNQFMIGDEIIVAPVVDENDERTIILPPGDWYYQNKKWKGGRAYKIKVALDELPVFMKKIK